MTSALARSRLNFVAAHVKAKCRHVYNQMFHRYLFYTNVGISISLSAVGDTLEQHYEILKHQTDKYEAQRTMRMSVSGMTVGILCHHWYRFLDSKFPGRTIQVVAKKVLVDQIVCSPLCIAIFFITLGLLEKTSWDEIKKEVKAKAWRLYVAEWVIWPPAQVINFYILPLRYRVLYDNTISLGYDVYTSRVKHDDSDLREEKSAVSAREQKIKNSDSSDI